MKILALFTLSRSSGISGRGYLTWQWLCSDLYIPHRAWESHSSSSQEDRCSSWRGGWSDTPLFQVVIQVCSESCQFRLWDRVDGAKKRHDVLSQRDLVIIRIMGRELVSLVVYWINPWKLSIFQVGWQEGIQDSLLELCPELRCDRLKKAEWSLISSGLEGYFVAAREVQE